MARKNQTLRDVLKNSYFGSLISLLQIIMKYCSKKCKKISEAYLGLCQTAEIH